MDTDFHSVYSVSSVDYLFHTDSHGWTRRGINENDNVQWRACCVRKLFIPIVLSFAPTLFIIQVLQVQYALHGTTFCPTRAGGRRTCV